MRAPTFSSRQASQSKDIFDLLGLHGDGWELFGAVAVSLHHQHQQVAVWNLLHHKHPETPNTYSSLATKNGNPRALVIYTSQRETNW